MLTTLLLWIVVGGIAGWLASLVMGTDARQGAVENIIVGIVGAFVGGFLYTLLTTGTFDMTNAITGLNISSIIISTIGAIVLIGVMGLFKGTRKEA